MARGASGVVQGGRRRDRHDHAQLRPRARRGRPDRDPGRGRHRARYPARLPVRRRRAPALRPARGGRILTFARRALVVVWKDLLVERRSKETLNALFFFGLLLLFVFQFALGPDRERLAGTLPGLLWLGFILSGLLALGRTFVVERENDCWEGLLLAPGDKSAIYVGKLAGNLLLMLAIEAILLVLFGFFFNLDLANVLPGLAVVIALGTVALAAVGTLFAAMTAQVRARELLFPVLLLPVEAPVLLATVKATEAVLLGETLGSVAHWLKLLAAADVVYVAVGVLTFDFVLEA
ncbi:MAG: cytochrome C biogenesis protein [Candidatus Rokuibacteriota bacterium]|nr:MAG: cytochrome C biogenesis protein [Candidatus Rokubacteria bacterium]